MGAMADMVPGMTDSRPAFVPLATLGDLMTAQIAVARLEAEGIPARILGEGLGPYRLTVGEFAATQIWVAEDRLAEAREVMIATEIDHLDDPTRGDGVRSTYTVMGVAAGVVLLAVVVYRLLAGLG